MTTTPTRARLRDESGVALVSVLGLALAMSLLVAASLAHALGGLRDAAREEDWTASLHAAEAGIDDYLFRLNNGDNYWQYSDTHLPADGNTAFTAETSVAGPANDSDFQYTVDISELATQGVIKVQSKGTHQGEERTVDVQLRRRGFLDYLYFTDLETRDPALYPTSGSRDQDWAEANCNVYKYNGRHADCTSIYFYSGDTINGPVHTNDIIQISGSPTFLQDTSSSWSITEAADCSHQRWQGSGSPNFPTACSPTYADPLVMPPSNASIKLETRGDLGRTGCLFTGPTSIEFVMSGSTPQMKVISPLSSATNCGAAVDGSATNLPDNGVIYVQNLPSSSSDPNYSTACNGGSPTHPLDSHLSPGDEADYDCADGDVFVWGEVGDRVTLAAANNIYVVADLTLDDNTGLDVIGLVANNYVQAYHPYGSEPYECGSRRRPRTCYRSAQNLEEYFTTSSGRSIGDREIWAAIVSVDHSFTVQNYTDGDPLGDLTVFGAIAQKYRGPVGTFYTSSGNPASGYDKDYNYDDRLRYISPPHFLDPVKSAWQVIDWSE